MQKEKIERYLGMQVIPDKGTDIVKCHNVIEVSSAKKLVCRYYNENGIDEDSYDLSAFYLDPGSRTACAVVSEIKHFLGDDQLLISESAVRKLEARH